MIKTGDILVLQTTKERGYDNVFDLFKKERKKEVPKSDDTPETVYNLDEEGLDAYANALASETTDTMQESFKQSQENSQKAYEAAVKLHRQYVASVDAKPYTGPVASVPLSPYEVLFLWYIEGCTAKEPGIAIYWTYEYNFSDFSEAIDKLLQAGYLRVSDYKFNMQKCTTTELKEVLKQHDLKVSGKKTDLIERLEANVNADVLKDTFSRGYLQLTEAGKLLTESYSHVILWHQYKNLMINDMNPASVHNFYLSHKHLSAHDVLIEYNKQYAEKWTADPSHLPPGVCYYAIGRMYELKQDFENALYWYFIRCYIDLSGVMYRDSNYSDIRERVSVAPAVLADVKGCVDTLALGDRELKKLYTTATSSLKIPGATYSVQEAYPLIMEALKNI